MNVDIYERNENMISKVFVKYSNNLTQIQQAPRVSCLHSKDRKEVHISLLELTPVTL